MSVYRKRERVEQDTLLEKVKRDKEWKQKWDVRFSTIHTRYWEGMCRLVKTPSRLLMAAILAVSILNRKLASCDDKGSFLKWIGRE